MRSMVRGTEAGDTVHGTDGEATLGSRSADRRLGSRRLLAEFGCIVSGPDPGSDPGFRRPQTLFLCYFFPKSFIDFLAFNQPSGFLDAWKFH